MPLHAAQDIIQRSHINRKWFYLFGAACLFAYLYVRPLIRRRLGSASSAYINYSACYICWLLMAVFYHLPSLESMGAWRVGRAGAGRSRRRV